MVLYDDTTNLEPDTELSLTSVAAKLELNTVGAFAPSLQLFYLCHQS